MDFDYVVVPALILIVGVLVIWLSVRRILALSAKVSRRWRRVAERIVLSVIILLAAAIAGSASYNSVALLWFRAHNPPSGDTYLVNGHKMHMVCIGTGSPTLVLDAGLGNDALTWVAVQPELAKTTRVCAYDRAGLGWSEATSAPRDADHITAELHDLLAQAKVTGPIVLMGHSIAGLYMRDYATRYPADIAGMVFVDSATPLQDRNLTPAMKADVDKRPPQWFMMMLTKFGFRAGIPRLFGLCSQSTKGVDAHTSKLLAEDMCHTRVGEVSAEMDSIDHSGEETIHTGPYGALPILIFSHDPAMTLPKPNPPQDLIDLENGWSRMQEDLKGLSTRSRRIIAKDSGHGIQLDRADLIEKEVPIFIEQIRGSAPQPTNNGSTVTE